MVVRPSSWGITMKRVCLACRRRSADTTPDYPALCVPCLHRAGRSLKPGTRVICTIDDGCSGVVNRIEYGLAVVATNDGQEAWIPIAETVAVRR